MADSEQYPGVKIEPLPEGADEATLPMPSSLKNARKVANDSSAKAFQNPHLSAVEETIQNGENAIKQVSRVEVKTFDHKFVDALETGLEAVGRILANPRTFIKETTELENVEKARKVSSLSIRHFATHSQYLRSVEDNGEVIPDKILTIHSETNTAIYENRFVMTLIRRCLSFIEQRYSFIKEHGETRDSDELFLHSETDFSGVNYEISMRIKASVPSSDAGESEKNADLLQRLELCKSRVGDYLHSMFMTQMKGAKEVTSPVHMTNMLLKHPDYHAAYELWEFIESYETLGVSYDVTERAYDFDEKYLTEIYRLLAAAALKLRTRHEGMTKRAVNGRRITPKIIFELDDMAYEDGRFLYDAFPAAKNAQNPVQFVLEEERKEARDRTLGHLSAEEMAKQRLDKSKNKEKDRVEYVRAKTRDDAKGELLVKVNIKYQTKQEEEAKKAAEAKKRQQDELAAKKKKEDRLYEEEKKRILGGKK